MFKKVIIMVAASVVVIGLCIAQPFIDSLYADKVIEHYTQRADVRTTDCVVVATDKGQTVLEEQATGMLWSLNDDSYTEGQRVCVWLSDNGTTERITDDVIVHVATVSVD